MLFKRPFEYSVMEANCPSRPRVVSSDSLWPSSSPVISMATCSDSLMLRRASSSLEFWFRTLPCVVEATLSRTPPASEPHLPPLLLLLLFRAVVAGGAVFFRRGLSQPVHVARRIEARHFLPFLETAQPRSVAHALADERPGNLDVVRLHHLSQVLKVGSRVDAQVFSDKSLELFRLALLPAAADVGVVDFSVLVPAGIRRPVELGLDVGPFLADPCHQTDQRLDLVVGPGAPLEGVELAESVPVDGLHRPIGKALSDFHPGPLQVRLVVALAAKPRNGDLFGRAVFLHGGYDDCCFFLAVFSGPD
mmetsp:Transcript_10132/g.22985  ORF Transcript_10132/g.22985 Transcript_10132/m.22985 type:complete len:306 (-) Transcript_10132:164-1081(-)